MTGARRTFKSPLLIPLAHDLLAQITRMEFFRGRDRRAQSRASVRVQKPREEPLHARRNTRIVRGQYQRPPARCIGPDRVLGPAGVRHARVNARDVIAASANRFASSSHANRWAGVS
jgi:hypothetical protein